MRILALDLGDSWVGVAISDPSGIMARPYKTIATEQLMQSLEEIIAQEKINQIIIGLPQTLRGTESQQTKKVRQQTADLEVHFPMIKFSFVDERFTSQQAASIKKVKNKDDKLNQHAIAAALLLTNFLEQIRFEAEMAIDL